MSNARELAEVATSYAAGNITGRNRIINGDMRIDQRNAGAAVTSSGFVTDRFNVQNVSDGAFSAQQDTSAPTDFINSLKVTVTTADASITTTQNLRCDHRIEGTNVSDLAWGSANAKTVTLSFWVRSSLTGTFGGSINNSAFNRVYPFSYSISVADTWEYKTVTIPGDTTGTWLTSTGIGINITWSLGSGPSRVGTANAWAASNLQGVTGQVQLLETLNATWYITGVQLEVGSVATPFEYRQFGTELQLCQRYFEKSYNQSVVPGSNAAVGMRAVYSSVGSASNRFFGDLNYVVPKRTNGVSITFYSETGTTGQISKYNSSSTTQSVSSIGFGYGETGIGTYIQTSSGDSSEPYLFHFTASSEL